MLLVQAELLLCLPQLVVPDYRVVLGFQPLRILQLLVLPLQRHQHYRLQGCLFRPRYRHRWGLLQSGPQVPRQLGLVCLVPLSLPLDSLLLIHGPLPRLSQHFLLSSSSWTSSSSVFHSHSHPPHPPPHPLRPRLLRPRLLKNPPHQSFQPLLAFRHFPGPPKLWLLPLVFVLLVLVLLHVWLPIRGVLVHSVHFPVAAFPFPRDVFSGGFLSFSAYVVCLIELFVRRGLEVLLQFAPRVTSSHYRPMCILFS
mmetsp:Transcript_17744/g.30186  ORF Transcript_17744/g.30186 Transcript_17744/m.30186 type:complete len:253 (-) Transcript_17744:587-1345(-)